MRGIAFHRKVRCCTWVGSPDSNNDFDFLGKAMKVVLQHDSFFI
jgi:hypothetical protein